MPAFVKYNVQKSNHTFPTFFFPKLILNIPQSFGLQVENYISKFIISFANTGFIKQSKGPLASHFL